MSLTSTRSTPPHSMSFRGVTPWRRCGKRASRAISASLVSPAAKPRPSLQSSPAATTPFRSAITRSAVSMESVRVLPMSPSANGRSHHELTVWLRAGYGQDSAARRRDIGAQEPGGIPAVAGRRVGMPVNELALSFVRESNPVASNVIAGIRSTEQSLTTAGHLTAVRWTPEQMQT